MNVTLTFNKKDILSSVALLTGYAGAHLSEDGSKYDIVSTSDNDSAILSRFYEEAKNTFLLSFKRVLLNESEKDGTTVVTCELSASYDGNLTPSVLNDLNSYFIQSIVSKWYSYTNKDGVESAALEATSFLESARRKVFSKRRPMRPVYQ